MHLGVMKVKVINLGKGYSAWQKVNQTLRIPERYNVINLARISGLPIIFQKINIMNKLKLVTVVILCLGATYLSQAQTEVGIRAGVLISKQDFNNGGLNVDPKSKYGADLAFVAEFGIGPLFAISPEFHWMQKGGKIQDLSGSFPESTQTFDYLEIPVLFKFKFGTGAGFFLFAGPSIGYLFNATDKDGDGHTNDIDLNDYKRAELGAHIGAGIKLGPINVDVRYIAGFSNIADYDGSNLEIKNSGYGAGVSLMF